MYIDQLPFSSSLPTTMAPRILFVFTSANKEISRGRQTVSASIQRHGYIYIALI